MPINDNDKNFNVQNFTEQQSNTQYSPSSQSLSMSNNQKHPIINMKMITFIDQLYSKYKILSKLTQQQSNLFQNQVIHMLIDEQENIDLDLYEQTVQKIGLDCFVLEVLASVIKRNKFHNHYEMNKNLEMITQDLQKQQKQLFKDRKQLDIRERKVKKKQEAMLLNVKEKIKQMEQQAKKRVMSSETEIKKRINVALAQLKTMEGEINAKLASKKEQFAKLSMLQQKEKSVDQKVKNMQRMERVKKQKQNQNIQSAKKISQLGAHITSLQDKNEKLNEQVKRLSKKIKTNELANKHVKDQAEKKLAQISQASNQLEAIKQMRDRLDSENDELREQNKILKQKIARYQAQHSLQSRKLIDAKTQIENLKSKFQQVKQKLLQQNSAAIPEFQTLQISNINYDNSKQEDYQNENCEQNKHTQLFKQQRQNLKPSLKNNQLLKTINNQQQQQQQEQEEDSQQEPLIFVKTLLSKPQKSLKKLKKASNKNTNSLIKPQLQKQQQQQQLQLQNVSVVLKNYFHDQRQQYLHEEEDCSLNEAKPKPKPKSLLIKQTNFLDELEADTQQDKSNNYSSSKFITTTAVTNKHLNSKNPKIQFIKEINQITLQEQEDTCRSIQKISSSDKILHWIQLVEKQFKMEKYTVQKIFELILIIIQPCQCATHQSCMNWLIDSKVIHFLQLVFLQFQASDSEIQCNSIFILSRILMSMQQLNMASPHSKDKDTPLLRSEYVKSLKIRKIAEKDEFFLSNINFLLELN